MGSRRLPEGIIEDILVRLPTKSIIRFKCVSKSWFNLIKSSNFVNKHLIECKESYVALFFAVHPTQRVNQRFLVGCLYDVYNETSDPWFQEGVINTSPVIDHFELPFSDKPTYPFPTLVGHCNGIMCLMIDSNTLLLTNPLLNEVKTLPVSPIGNSVPCLEMVGFGFDDVTMDFKVVRIFGLVKSPQGLVRSPQGANEDNGYQRAEVYNLRTNAWGELNEFPLVTYYSTSGSTFFNGVVHWCARTEYLGWRMLTLNMTTELFEHVEFPQGWNDDGRPYCDENVPALFVMNEESLAFVSYCHIYYSDHIVDIWTMNEHGNGVAYWTKLYSIGPLLDELQGPILLSPIGLPKKNELIYYSNELKLILCDLPDHRRRSVICDVDSQLSPYDVHDMDSWIVMGLYRPSFVSIHM